MSIIVLITYKKEPLFVDLPKQKSYKYQLITWWTGITRPAGSWNLVTLKTNFAQYKNFVCLKTKKFNFQIRCIANIY